MRKYAIVKGNFVTSAHVCLVLRDLCALAGLNCSVGFMFALLIVLFTADHRCVFRQQKTAAQISLWLWNAAESGRRLWACARLSTPLTRSEPCPFEMFFVQCGASQMNGPWSSEVSLVDPGVTQTQWWPSFYRKNKNRDPQAHGPRCGRGLDMAILKKGRTKWSYIWGDVLDLKCRLQFHKCSLMFRVFIFTWGILNYKHDLLRAPVVFIWLFQSQTWRARLPEMMPAPALPADLWSAFVPRAPSLTERGKVC